MIPSLPGHGFSAKPAATGWDPPRIARAWVVLMKRLGYDRFVAKAATGARSWAERAYPHNLIHYNQLDKGGHFAAWEQTELFSAEMRAAFKTLR